METLKFVSQLLLIASFTLPGSLALSGQTNPIETAKPFIVAKQFGEAVTVYENWLVTYPNDANIWRELGVVQSWNGQQLKSIEAFKKALELEPGNLETHRSLGYAYAWRGDYARANEMFAFVLEKAPTDEEAQKGLAYIALWSGNGKKTAPVFAEIDIWGGYSKVANSSSDGLRLMQVALQLRQDLRVYARFDKSLSVDNLDLLRRNVRGNVYNLGGFYSWNDKTGTTVEAGMREFGEAQPRQYTLRAEQTYAVGKNFHLKGGLMAAFGKSTPSEWVLFAGTQVSVSHWLTLEPGFFFTRLNAFSFDHRFALNTKFLPGKGYELNVGVLTGRAQIENEATMRNLTGAYFVGIFPISKPIWLMASYRYENGFFDKLNTAALGVRFRFGQPR